MFSGVELYDVLTDGGLQKLTPRAVLTLSQEYAQFPDELKFVNAIVYAG